MRKFTTLAYTKDNQRLNLTETVYQTGKQLKGTFSVEDVLFDINIQLLQEGEEEVSRKDVQSRLNELSKVSRIVKLNSVWYSWQA